MKKNQNKFIVMNFLNVSLMSLCVILKIDFIFNNMNCLKMFGCFGKSIRTKETETKETKDAETIAITSIKIKPIKPKKKISATLKRLVWNTNIGEEIGKTKCLCCKSTDISQMSFHCGHVVAEANGGELIVSNLKPICQNCNSSMGTKNMNDFMDTFK